ncbi:MAG: hypothetical protein Q8K78_03055 [Planctomycetaceae bacterium]|nr:hypothetical protein [Planctomycetaceae bacterium]
MKTNRWFPVPLIVGTLILTNLSLPVAFSDDTAQPGHSHKADKPDEAKIKAAMAKLPEADRSAAAAQRYCPMMDTVRLGAMGAPLKVVIEGKPVFVCCAGCKDEAVEHGKKTLTTVDKLKKATAAIAKLPAADQVLAEAQLFCPIQDGSRLGSMGMPVKLMLEGKPVFLCCKGCEDAARKNTKTTLAKVEEIKKGNATPAHHDDHQHGAAPKKN